MPSISELSTVSTFVDEADPTLDHTSYYFLAVGVNQGTGPLEPSSPYYHHPATYGRCYTWLRFDLSAIPITAVITSVLLYFDLTYVYSAGSYDDTILEVHRSTNITWLKSITWNTQDNASVSGSISDSAVVPANTAPVSLMGAGLVSDIQAALSTGAISWRLKVDDGNVISGYGINLASNTWPLSTVLSPRLDVTYTVPSGLRLLSSTGVGV